MDDLSHQDAPEGEVGTQTDAELLVPESPSCRKVTISKSGTFGPGAFTFTPERSSTSKSETKSSYTRSRSGADLLFDGTFEWWAQPESVEDGWQPESAEEAAKSQQGGAALLKSKKEWWNIQRSNSTGSSSGPDPGRPSQKLKLGGWWGDHPKDCQGSGPRTKACQRGCLGPIRGLASNERNRYQVNGFDLDLTYITSRIIAMGFPAGMSRSFFRNPRGEVAKFLNSKHKDHFRIYNLCIEPSYQYNGFPENTVHYPCPDHCPLSLAHLLAFCRNAEEWLRADPDNVALIHCKAGKGRSGTMICALLVYAGAVGSAFDALSWYAMARGGKREGVTIPSQIRFIAMFERWIRHGSVDLCSDPMNAPSPCTAESQLAARETPHRLIAVRVGPVYNRFLAPHRRQSFMKRQWSIISNHTDTSDVIEGAAATVLVAGVRIGISNRDVFATKARVVHWFDEQIVEASADNILQVKLLDGPIWNECDGVIVVLVRNLASPMTLGKNSMSASAWWCHSYLHRREAGYGRSPTLLLDLPKPCIDTLARDMQKNHITPPTFRFSAIFQDLATRPCCPVVGDDAALQPGQPVASSDSEARTHPWNVVSAEGPIDTPKPTSKTTVSWEPEEPPVEFTENERPSAPEKMNRLLSGIAYLQKHNRRMFRV